MSRQRVNRDDGQVNSQPGGAGLAAPGLRERTRLSPAGQRPNRYDRLQPLFAEPHDEVDDDDDDDDQGRDSFEDEDEEWNPWASDDDPSEPVAGPSRGVRSGRAPRVQVQPQADARTGGQAQTQTQTQTRAGPPPSSSSRAQQAVGGPQLTRWRGLRRPELRSPSPGMALAAGLARERSGARGGRVPPPDGRDAPIEVSDDEDRDGGQPVPPLLRGLGGLTEDRAGAAAIQARRQQERRDEAMAIAMQRREEDAHRAAEEDRRRRREDVRAQLGGGLFGGLQGGWPGPGGLAGDHQGLYNLIMGGGGPGGGMNALRQRMFGGFAGLAGGAGGAAGQPSVEEAWKAVEFVPRPKSKARPGFTFDFDTEAENDVIGIDLDEEEQARLNSASAASADGSKASLVCAGCMAVLRVSQGQKSPDDRVHSLSCGHLVDQRCLHALIAPPRESMTLQGAEVIGVPLMEDSSQQLPLGVQSVLDRVEVEMRSPKPSSRGSRLPPLALPSPATSSRTTRSQARKMSSEGLAPFDSNPTTVAGTKRQAPFSPYGGMPPSKRGKATKKPREFTWHCPVQSCNQPHTSKEVGGVWVPAKGSAIQLFV